MTAREPLSAWLARLGALPVTRVAVEARCVRGLDMADPICAVARGLAGERLRDLRCLTRTPTCEACLRAEACDYARIVGAEAMDGDVHPYWLQGLPASNVVRAGAVVDAAILVAGEMSARAPYLDVALRDALVRLGSEDDAGADVRWVLGPSRVEPVRLVAAAEPGPVDRITIDIRTPLLLRGDFERARELCPSKPWFGLLVRAGIRRLDALLGMTAAGERPRVELPSVASVRHVAGEVVAWSSSRWSRRQDRRFPLEGWTGSITLAGDGLAEILPLLRVLEATGVGRKTTMGFGWIIVTTHAPG